MLIPIFYTIEGKSLHKKKNIPSRIIYSGGTQPWQCAELMMQYVHKTINLFQWIILSTDVAYFEAKSRELNVQDKIFIKSVAPDDVALYYEYCDFGIILREDNIVNRVACPTKLIEYLQYGLVPVVLSPHIGDFDLMGYQYITIDDLEKECHCNSINFDQIRKKNRKVIDNIQNIAETNLKQLYNVVFETVLCAKTKTSYK